MLPTIMPEASNFFGIAYLTRSALDAILQAENRLPQPEERAVTKEIGGNR